MGNNFGFTGDFDIAFWSMTSEGSGKIETTKNYLHILGSDESWPTAFNLRTAASLALPISGTYSFEWDYSNLDAPVHDYAYYSINGVETQLSTGGGGSIQGGAVTITLNAGDVLAFGINSLFDTFGPATLLISEFRAPSACTCAAESACNYNPGLESGAIDDCDWSCFGCPALADVSCNAGLFDVQAEPSTAVQVVQDILATFGFTESEAEAYVMANVFSLPCTFIPVPGIFDCSCTVALPESSGYVQSLIGETYVLDAPMECAGLHWFGAHSGLGSAHTFEFPCDAAQGVINLEAYQNNTYEVFVPAGMTDLWLYGTGDSGNAMTIYASPTTVIHGAVGDLTTAVVNAGYPICGCTDPVACNYLESANTDDGSCHLPDGCVDPLAINFNPCTTCSGGCLFLNSCGQLANPVEGLLSGFNGGFAPGSWSFDSDGSDGTIVHSERYLQLVGSNDGSGGTEVSATLTLPASGYYSFNWRFVTPDGSFTDAAAYTLNGTRPLSTGGSFAEEGTVAFIGSAGDSFGFQVETDDGLNGAGTLTISNFIYPAGVLPPCVVGCTYPDASNFSPAATSDNGSCLFDTAELCVGDLDYDGSIATNDLLIVIGLFGTACP